MALRPQGGGRQKGTPNKASVAGRDIAAQWGPDAIRQLATLAGLVKDPEGNPIGRSANDTVVMNSCATLIERAFGKVAQPIVGDDNDDPIRTVMRIEFVDGAKS